MRQTKGFTLIELMIVIAIIAIIAAIAIPGLLSSQRAANERNASASAKTLATAQADFRSNDRDANAVNDFWISDVQGLYAIQGPDGQAINLIEVVIARADAAPTSGAGGTTYAAVPAAAPKAGYWFRHLTTFEDSTGSVVYDLAGNARNTSKFGYIMYPDQYGSSGKLEFIISEGNTMFKRDPGAAAVPSVSEFPLDPTAAAPPWGAMD